MTARAGRLALPALVVGLFAAGPLRADGPVDRCRAADKDFDYERAVTECAVAAAAPGASREELVDVYRILGIAHTALGDPRSARVWFLRLLVLDPVHEMGDDVSPVYRASFAEARTAFLEEGKVQVEHTPPSVPDEVTGPLPVSFVVVDRLDRVRAARVEVKALGDDAPGAVQVALQQTAGEATPRKGYAGQIVALGPPGEDTFALTYRLILIGPDGAEIDPDPALAPVELEVSVPAAAAGGGGFPWLWLGAGGAGVGAIVVVGAGAAAAVACVVTGVCVPTQTVPHSQVRVGPALAE